MDFKQQFLNQLNNSLSQNSFVKLSFANYKGKTEFLKNCYVKLVKIKNENKLSFTYRYKTNDIVKNYDFKAAADVISDLLSEFLHASLFTLENDFVFEIVKNGKSVLRTLKPSQTSLPSTQHNIEKIRQIKSEGKPYLQQLKITDDKGNVFNNAQDKYKQINHYIDLLSPLIKHLPAQKKLSIVDMGAGKGYLTFALYDYLVNVLKLNAEVTGVEFRKDLVDLCNSIANSSGFNALKFKEGTILDTAVDNTNVLIALHACDTATDDAIYKGIDAGADLIIVAPCCHKQIRRELEASKKSNELDFLLKHGIFLERQAEMLTDGIRALLLEYSGYSTKVFQFISDAHTPKNVMIVAEKKSKTELQKEQLLLKLKETKTYFGIGFHYLEKLLKL